MVLSKSIVLFTSLLLRRAPSSSSRTIVTHLAARQKYTTGREKARGWGLVQNHTGSGSGEIGSRAEIAPMFRGQTSSYFKDE